MPAIRIRNTYIFGVIVALLALFVFALQHDFASYEVFCSKFVWRKMQVVDTNIKLLSHQPRYISYEGVANLTATDAAHCKVTMLNSNVENILHTLKVDSIIDVYYQADKSICTFYMPYEPVPFVFSVITGTVLFLTVGFTILFSC